MSNINTADLAAAVSDPCRLIRLESTGRWALCWPWGWPFIADATAKAARWWLVAWGWAWADAQRAVVDLGQVARRRYQETAESEVRRGLTLAQAHHLDQVRRWRS